METGREEINTPEVLELSKYLNSSEFTLEEDIVLEINVKHITAKGETKEYLQWDAKKKIKETNLKQIAGVIFLLNTNKTFAGKTSTGKPAEKKYTKNDVLEHLLKTTLFEDLKQARAKFEKRTETNFDKPVEIEKVHVSSVLDNIGGFREKTTFDNKGVIYEIRDEKIVNGAIKFLPQHTIYETFAGVGNRSKLLVAPDNYFLNKGLVSEYIGYLTKKEVVDLVKQLSFETLSFIAKNIGVQTARGEQSIGFKELKKGIVERHTTINCFLKPIPPVDINKLKSTKGLKSVLMKAINAGLERPPIIDKIYLSTFGEVESVKYNFHIMQYQPHASVQTGTKIGKSSSAASIGTNHDKITIAGALGFSTADKRERGAFDGQTRLQAADEVKEYATDVQGGHFLNYLEKGEFKNTAGMGSECHGCHPFFMQSNSKNIMNEGISQWGSMDAEKAALSFTNTVAKITTNFVAFGSRIGIVCFRPDLQGVKGEPISISQQQKAQALWHFVQRHTSKKYTSVFKNKEVQKWLWQCYTKEQGELLQELKNKADISELKDFISGMQHNYKHLKGGAINLAFFDQIEELMNDKSIDFELLLEDAKTHAAELFDLNVDSLTKMVSAFSGEVYKEYMDSYFNSISGKKRLLLDLVCLELYENPEIEEIVVEKMAEKVAILAQKVTKNVEKWPKKEVKKYENYRPGQVLEIFEKRWNWYFNVLERFGIEPVTGDKINKLMVKSSKKSYLIMKGKELFSGSDGSSESSNHGVSVGNEEKNEVPDSQDSQENESKKLSEVVVEQVLFGLKDEIKLCAEKAKGENIENIIGKLSKEFGKENVEQTIGKMLENGDLFQRRPGIVKIL